MNYTLPENVGVLSENITKYITELERKRLSTHDIIIARGNEIFYEAYWKPFDRNFKHRMYSVSKSVVALAVGFLEQDGKINLDDKIIKYFPDELENQTDENMKNQTIRNMLMMCTAKQPQNWFAEKPDDRVRFYFENDNFESRPGGTVFQYDSTGSFILCAMVERLCKKPFMEYLREKLFDKIGVSKDAYCLKCPGGHSWGDSGILCTPLDLLKIARFTMNLGKWNNEQILNEKYLKDATSKLVDNSPLADFENGSFGYGYQIWRTYENSYFFNGMGCQFAICVPDKDIIMIYNGDNQGKSYAKGVIIENFFKYIADRCENQKVKVDEEERNKLLNLTENLELATVFGNTKSPFSKDVNGVKYVLDKNPMGILWFRLHLDCENGVFEYENAQGNKKIPFGFGKNVYSKFPQDGYSDEVGTKSSDIHYTCASSASWVEEKKINIFVQIIDKYFGNLHIVIGFEKDRAGLYMCKTAEDFLEEYEGFAGGTALR